MSFRGQKTEQIKAVLEDVEHQYKLSQIDTLLTDEQTPILDELKQNAVFDALQDINSAPPVTTYSLEAIVGTDPKTSVGDPRYYTLLKLGVARNIFEALMVEWTSNGFSATIAEQEAESKLGDYQTLVATLAEKFDTQIEKLKTGVEVYTKGLRSRAEGGDHPVFQRGYRSGRNRYFPR